MAALKFSGLKACFVNCTLKRSPRISNTRGLMNVSANIMKKEGVDVEFIRLVDHEVPFGMQPDMTEDGWDRDEWPKLYERIIAADILIVGSPIWLGSRSAVASNLIDRMYAMSSKQNEKGQYIYYGKVGGCVITGNEDGVKHCSAGILYALSHIGYSIPPQADCGWIGEIGPGPSYLDPEADAKNHEFTNKNTTFMTYNVLQLAKLLKANNGYSGYGNSIEAWENGERWKFEKPTYKNL
ncbi:MAG TPA: NAD(P)H-dependent oxidoreductase [Flavobacteriaceae bacterium]|nr:NAD(P)H-dependent oxidoreductase [Flavobacteriaceae bacterium]